MAGKQRTVLWWGKYDSGYSRNRIIEGAFAHLGWNSQPFQPRNSSLGYFEARFVRLPRPDIVFVPCFCQRDIEPACEFARHHRTPVVIDPLISLYDTRVFERQTVRSGSHKAQQLLEREQRAFNRANVVIADTEAHGHYFSAVLGVPPSKIVTVPVGAEEPLFSPPAKTSRPNTPVQVLFYGSFIPLQGTEIIIEAIRRYKGPPVRWCLLGGSKSTRRRSCEQLAVGLADIMFEDDIPYASLPTRIHEADILLGVFGETEKTVRVIPNKVYQALACGRPVVTCEGPYPPELRQAPNSGLFWVPPGDATSLASAVARLASNPAGLREMGQQARRSYEGFFGNQFVTQALAKALQKASHDF